MNNPQTIVVSVKTTYLDNQSWIEEQQFAFAYTVTIENHSQQNVQLLSRHWIVTDSSNNRQEVQGLGVVGEQPYILSGGDYSYTSGVVLPTRAGMMEGAYEMQTDGGGTFSVPIPAFSLTCAQSLH